MSASLFPRINLREGSENLGVKTESQPTEYNNWIMLKELYLEASSHSYLYGSYQTCRSIYYRAASIRVYVA